MGMSFITEATKFVHRVSTAVQEAAKGKPYNLTEAQTAHNNRKTEMADLRSKLNSVDDKSKDYLTQLNRYQELVTEEENEQDKLRQAMQDGPPQDMPAGDRDAYNTKLKNFDDELTKTINGDDDGDADGGHDLGKGRFLVSVDDEGGSMMKTAHALLGDQASDSRILQLNRNVFDPNASDYNMDTPPAEGFRDPDLVRYGDMIVIGVDQKALELDPEVVKAINDKKAAYPDDKKFAQRMDGFASSSHLLGLKDKDKQLEAVNAMGMTQLTADKRPLTDAEFHTMEEMVTSDGYFSADPKTRGFILSQDPKNYGNFTKILNSPGFKTLDDQAAETSILSNYAKDPAYAGKVDKIVGDTKISPADQKAAFKELYVRGELMNTANGAGDFAKNDNNINDPLLRAAKNDPVNFAHQKLAMEHKDDPDYLAALNKTVDDVRIEYTTNKVKELHDKGDDVGALKVLKTNMDAATSADVRAKIFDAAGKNIYTKDYVTKMLEKTDQFKAYGESAPSEVANIMVDVLEEKLQQPPKQGEDPFKNLQSMMRTDGMMGSSDKKLFEGVSAIVEAADTHGGHVVDGKLVSRAPEMAKILKNNVYTVDHTPMSGSYPGLTNQIETSVGDGNAGLSVALINEFTNDPKIMAIQKTPFGDRMKDEATAGANNAYGLRTQMINSFGRGVQKLNENTQNVVGTWQTDNARNSDFMNTVGALDQDKALKAIATDRRDHPDDARKIDNDMEAVYDQGVKVFRFNQDIQNLKLDFDNKDEVGGVKEIKSQINELNKKDNATTAMVIQPGAVAPGQRAVMNPELQNYFNGQLDFGAVESPGSRLQEGIEGHRQKLFKWLDDNKGKIPPATDKAIRDHTNAYMDKVQAIVLASPDDAGKAMETATNEYIAQLKGDLKDSPIKPTDPEINPDDTQAPNGMQTKLRDDWHAWQKELVVARLARFPFADDLGPALTTNYARRYQALYETGRSINAATAHGQPATATAAATAPGAAYRPLRAIGFLAFAEGAYVLGFGTKADHSDGAYYDGKFNSDDMYATMFTVGTLTEGYRLATGRNLGPSEALHPGWDKAAGARGVAPTAAEFGADAARFGSRLFVGTGLSIADTKWAVEDWQDVQQQGWNPTTGGKAIGTTLLATSDWVGIAAFATPLAAEGLATLGIISAETAAAVGSSGWIPVVGWVAAVGILAGQTIRYVAATNGEKNKFEFDNDPRYAKMVKEMGFTDDQARELMNRNGGASDVKVNDWEWFIPVWNGVQAVHSAYGEVNSFFTEGGVSPFVVLNGMWGKDAVPPQQRLQYLQSLNKDEIIKLVKICHNQLDHNMNKDNGYIDPKHYDEVKAEMVKQGLWKENYLGPKP